MSRSMLAPTGRRQRGFTFVELLVTAIILGTSFVAATWSMSATARTKAMHDKAATPAFFLAKEMFELADRLPRQPSGVTGVTLPEAILALDSLDGASFSPPLLADGSAAGDFEGWSQHVDVSVYDMANPATPVPGDAWHALPADAAQLYRLEVAIRCDGQDIDTFHWWINP